MNVIPSSKGPPALFFMSGQHPNVVVLQDGRGLHILGVFEVYHSTAELAAKSSNTLYNYGWWYGWCLIVLGGDQDYNL